MRSLTRARPQVQNPPERADFYIYIRHPFRKGGRRQCKRYRRNAKSEESTTENLKGEAGIDSRTARPAHSGFAVSTTKNQKETIPAHKIWISSIAQSMCCKLWSSPLAQVSESGALLTCWKDTETTIRGLMLMVSKEARREFR